MQMLSDSRPWGMVTNVIDPPKDKNANPTVRWKFKAFAQPVWVMWKTTHAPVFDLDNDGKKR
jgi:hypothetical protein